MFASGKHISLREMILCKWILLQSNHSRKDFNCMSQWRITCITVAISSVTSWPHPICPSGGVDTHHVPDIWEQPILQPPPHPEYLPNPHFPVAAEATGLMGTAYLYPAPYQIVDTNRYPRNENILLLLTLTLAYMDLHLYARWDKQLLCSVCVGGCECLWVSTFADRCIK